MDTNKHENRNLEVSANRVSFLIPPFVSFVKIRGQYPEQARMSAGVSARGSDESGPQPKRSGAGCRRRQMFTNGHEFCGRERRGPPHPGVERHSGSRINSPPFNALSCAAIPQTDSMDHAFRHLNSRRKLLAAILALA